MKNTYSGFLEKDASTLSDDRSEAVKDKEKKSKGSDWLAKAKEFYGLQDFDTESFMPDELKGTQDGDLTDSLPEPASEDQIQAESDKR